MKNFNDIYEKIYKDNYSIIEEKRKAAKKRIVIIFVLVVGIGIILSNIVPKNGWLAILLSVLVALIYIAGSSKSTHYNRAYKQLVINNFIEEYDTNLQYRHNRGLSSNIYTMGEFEKFDRYFSEDWISGTLNNKTNIVMSEVKTERRERDNKGRTYYVTIFHGLFAEVSLDKIIDSTTRVRRNRFKLIDRADSLSMDSGEFESLFDVYSDGKIETMQILTLDIMQKIIDFTKQTKVIPEFTIKENCIYLRFNMGDIFEANVLKSGLDYETLKKYYDIINFIENIIDEITKNLEDAGI